MAITETQRENRRKHIGSSDVAPILGLSQWRSAWDVWAEKTGRLEDRPSEQSDAMLAGTLFEDGVLRWAESRLGPILRNQYRRAEGLPIAVHLDGLTVDGDPVEAKTSGLFWTLPDGWGEDESDQVPDDVLCQCHAHMLATSSLVCHVPTFLGGRGFAYFRVERNDELAATIAEAAVAFWCNVQNDTPPPESNPSCETIQRIRRTPGHLLECSPETDMRIRHWTEAREERLSAEKHEALIRTALLGHLGDAEGAHLSDGSVLTYYRSKSRRYFDQKAFARECPDLAAKYTSDRPGSRTLYLKKGKL